MSRAHDAMTQAGAGCAPHSGRNAAPRAGKCAWGGPKPIGGAETALCAPAPVKTKKAADMLPHERTEALSGLLRDVCAHVGVSAADVVSIGRKFDFVKGRALFCVVATREGFRQIDVAAYLGRSHATVYHYQQIYKNGEYWLLGLVKGYDEIRK